MVWGANDMWRHHPLIARGYRASLPGLKYAVPIFAAYVVVDTLFGSDGHHGHHHASNVIFEKEGVGQRPTAVEGHGDHHH